MVLAPGGGTPEPGHAIQHLDDQRGANAGSHLNVPPNRDRLIDERDVVRLEELGARLRKEFGNPLKAEVIREATDYPTQPVYLAQARGEKADIQYVELCEDIACGQWVESFQIEVQSETGAYYPLYQGTTIGYQKICRLEDPFAGQNPLTRTMAPRTQAVRIRITAARGEVKMKTISLYAHGG